MAKYKVQIRVQGSSNGYAAVEVPPYDAGATASKNEWRPWYDYYTFRPIEYADSSRFQILPFIKWAIQITPNEFVTAEMLSDITGGRTSIESSSPSFSPFSNVDKEYDADGQPVLTVRATVYFATGDPAVDPPPANKKRVTVTVTNGTPPDSESHTASGTVTVNGNTSETTATATGLVSSDGTDEFSYSISATPAANYVFEHWNDGDTSPSKSGSTRTGASFTAYFKKRHTVKIFEHTIGGSVQEVRINTPYVNGNYTGYHDEGEQISIYFTPAEGATAVRFRAAMKNGNTETLLWNADGETTKAFFMPDADVVVAIGCFYEEVTVRPQIYTDGVLDGTGGTVSPVSAQGGNGDEVRFTATADTANEYELGTSESGYVWDWVGDIFDLGGQPSTRSGSQSSATLAGNAAAILAGLPSWTGLDDLPATWFMQSSYETPKVYFRYAHKGKIRIKVTFQKYGNEGSVFMYPDYPSFDNYEFLGTGDIDTTVDCGENKQVAILIAPKVHVDILGHATLPYFPYSLYLYYLFGIQGSYKWSGGAQSTDGIGFAVDAGPGYDGVEYTFIATMWPVTTNKILYSPDNDGAILCRSDGKPMAQYIV